MNDALKELFNAYKHLPVGVLFFKEGELFFVNEHLRSILLLANLSANDIIQIIGSMIGLENPSHTSLHEFLEREHCFLYRDRIIQINAARSENIDIYVLNRLSDKTIEAVDASHPIRSMHTANTPSPIERQSAAEEEKILRSVFENWNEGHFPTLVLYKGIPIKGECQFIGIEDDTLKLKVEKRQLISAIPGAQWLIGSKRDKMVSGNVHHYDMAENTVSLVDIKIVSQGFHQRNLIRYEADENDLLMIKLGGKRFSLPIRNISEKGVSIHTEDTAALVDLSTASGRSIDGELVVDGKKIGVRLVKLYTLFIQNSTLTKVAFSIGYDLHNGAKLREWLNRKQLHLIKEVRSFVQMMPQPK